MNMDNQSAGQSLFPLSNLVHNTHKLNCHSGYPFFLKMQQNAERK